MAGAQTWVTEVSETGNRGYKGIYYGIADGITIGERDHNISSRQAHPMVAVAVWAQTLRSPLALFYVFFTLAHQVLLFRSCSKP